MPEYAAPRRPCCKFPENGPRQKVTAKRFGGGTAPQRHREAQRYTEKVRRERVDCKTSFFSVLLCVSLCPFTLHSSPFTLRWDWLDRPPRQLLESDKQQRGHDRQPHAESPPQADYA